jgi:hypothetical protein
VKVILATVLIVGGLFIWAMMQFTSLGYTGWGIILGPVAVLSGVLVATDKS